MLFLSSPAGPKRQNKSLRFIRRVSVRIFSRKKNRFNTLGDKGQTGRPTSSFTFWLLELYQRLQRGGGEGPKCDIRDEPHIQSPVLFFGASTMRKGPRLLAFSLLDHMKDRARSLIVEPELVVIPFWKWKAPSGIHRQHDNRSQSSAPSSDFPPLSLAHHIHPQNRLAARPTNFPSLFIFRFCFCHCYF